VVFPGVLLSYPPPTILPNTLRLYGQTNGSNLITAPDLSFSFLLTFDGTNFFYDPAAMIITYGPGVCTLRDLTTSTSIVCATGVMPTISEGNSYNFTVNAGGQSISGSDQIAYPSSSPRITGVTGCDSGFTDCPTDGNIVITITGVNLNGTGRTVSVGSSLCVLTITQPVSPTQLTCTLPAGVGQNIDILLAVNGKAAFSSQAGIFVSYAQPQVFGVYGCKDSGPGYVTGCSRDQSSELDIVGQNFGAKLPVILVGGMVCENVALIGGTQFAQKFTSGYLGVDHTYIRCDLPAGTGDLLPLIVLQEGGGLSHDVFLISYDPCPVGTYLTGGSCVSCAAGTYSSVAGVAVCDECPSGRYSNDTGLSDCLLCAPGYFIADSSEQQCTACGVGKYGAQDGMTACLDCEPGRYVNATNALDCITCDDGEYQPSSGNVLCLGCIAGTYSEITKRTCLACPNGRYSDDGMSTCTDCGVGRYATPTGCQDCPAGSSSIAGSIACTACEPGRYNQYNGGACFNCPAGQYQDRDSALSCIQCGDGTYSASDGRSCQTCDVGRYSRTNISDSCLPCPSGTEQPGQDPSQCEPCVAGSYSFDGLFCRPCEAGRVSNDSASQCEQCPPGTYPRNDSTGCLTCPVGKYRPATCIDCLACLDCPIGRFREENDTTRCVDCPVGKTLDLDTFVCTNCIPGEFYVSSPISLCFLCPLGKISMENSSLQCDECPEGRQAAPTRTKCEDCPAGYYLYNTTVCELCEPGKAWTRSNTSGSDFTVGYCNNCPIGTFQSLPGSSVCSQCEPGRYAADPGASTCLNCPAHTYADHGSSGCHECFSPRRLTDNKDDCLCGAGYWSVPPPNWSGRQYDTQCVSCPEGAKCNSEGLMVDDVQAKPGYWRNNFTTEFFACIEPSHCLGGAKCAEGRAGPLCAQCQPGYSGSTYDVCNKCPSKEASLGLSILFIALIILALALLYWSVLRPSSSSEKYYLGEEAPSIIKDRRIIRNSEILALPVDDYLAEYDLEMKGHEVTSYTNYARLSGIYNIKILVAFLQVATALRYLPALLWPQYFRQFIAAFDFINLSFVPWSSIGCMVSYDYYEKTVIVMIIPIALFVFISLVIFPTLYILNRLDLSDAVIHQNRRNKFVRIYFKLVIFTLFLIYPAISRQIVSIFHCTDIGDVSYLVVDTTLQCHTARWQTYAIVAAIGTVVYPIGIPLVFFGILWRHRHQLQKPEIAAAYGFLYEAFHQNIWWFELVDMLYKFFMTSVLLFFPQNGQLVVALILCVSFIIFILLQKPYVRAQNELLALLVQVELFLLILAGYVTTVKGQVSGTNEVLLSILLIAAVTTIFLFFVMGLVLASRSVVKKQKRDRAATKAATESNLQSSLQTEYTTADSPIEAAYGTPFPPSPTNQTEYTLV